MISALYWYSRTSQYRRSWDWRKTGGIPKRRYFFEKPYLGHEMGGGIGSEAVLGGAVLGVYLPLQLNLPYFYKRTL